MSETVLPVKRALCVGINDYPGFGSDLAGCLNDASDWAEELRRRGYAVTMLLDRHATRAGIVDELRRLVEGAPPGARLVFTYSGHGSWLPDDDGDEPDGRDEMLCPYDVGPDRFLLDDDLAEVFDRKPDGARLYFISDSCHSGTVSRFAPPLSIEATALRPRPRFLPPASILTEPAVRDRLARAAHSMAPGHRKFPALLAAACGDLEYSFDASFNGRPNGAFTRVALDALKKAPATPRAWMEEIRRHLPTAAYPQTPRLYGRKEAMMGPMF